ncbi:MAG TPA: sugar phosphate isomerase/epimerase [Phycisphaerae bacterium]|nr:sugar phosphate isomerase/epimerase [Phycisphaerae bacterium]
MKSAMLVLLCLAAAVLCVPAMAADEPATQSQGRAAQQGRRGGGWKLGVQAWTFHKYTLFEAIDKTKELRLKYMECFPRQPLSPEQKDVTFNESSPPEVLDKVKARLKEAGIEVISFGVVKMGTEEEARKVFEFARKMGVTTLTAEPPQDAIKMIDKLANEYEIDVAIHNHPKPSHYWSPDTVLDAIKGCSKRMGACADTGHWTRSGLDPLECLKKLDGRVLACHFKDLNEKGPKAHDVVWGTGVNNAQALLQELRRQKFDGPLMIEYEHNWENSMPDIKQCIEFFRKTVREMRGSGQPRSEGKKKEAEKQE